tara:strand:+ start:287 stop:415 length:129 start_codon:yes stop_codon:yes gene_type:complete
MKKIKLFRNGKLVGLVNRQYHMTEEQKMFNIWDELDLAAVNL